MTALRSKVRKWLKKAQKHAQRTTREDDPESIVNTLAIMLIDSTMRDRKDKPEQDFLRRSHQKYTGDATSFELGIYMFFRLDLWHIQEGYDAYYRDAILYANLIPTFVSVFEKALGTSGLAHVFDNRMDLYGRIIRTESEPAQRIHYYLVQLLLRTARNTASKVHDFDSLPVMLAPVPDDQIVQIEVAAFEKGMLPSVFSMVSKAYSLITP